MLIYSVEDSYTFENLKDWIEDASLHLNLSTIEWALIGNKCDLTNDVRQESIEARRKDLEAKTCFTVSAKTGHNIKQAFNSFISVIHKTTKEAHPDGRPRQNTITVDSAAAGTEQKKACTCN